MRTRFISNWHPHKQVYDGKTEFVLNGLTEWEENPGEPRKLFSYTDELTGVVHVRLTKTSPIVRVKGTQCMTEGSIYILGKPSPQWIEKLVFCNKWDEKNPLPLGDLNWMLLN
jgi:hypothetical protein